MLASIQSAGLHGIDAFPVLVEVDCASQGLPGWSFTGLPEAAIKESKERVTSALRHTGIELRAQKITVNLAPARRKKVGNYFDLPIAVGMLVGSGALSPTQVAQHLFIGELQLSGALQAVPGALSIARSARADDWVLVGPTANADEFSLVRDLRYVPVDSLSQLLSYFSGERAVQIAVPTLPDKFSTALDLADVKGNGWRGAPWKLRRQDNII